MSGHVGELIPAHVLRTLEPDEAEQLEEHLRECQICRLECDQMEQRAASLALALDLIEPPPELRERILGAARSEGQPTALVLPATPEDSAVSRNEPAGQGTPAPIPFRPRTKSRAGFTVASLVSAAAVVLFALGITAGHFMQSPTASAQQRYDHLVTTAVERNDRVVALVPKVKGIDAHMVIARSPSGGLVMIAGPTSPPPKGKVYQLWFIRANHAPVSMAVLIPGLGQARSVPLAGSSQEYQEAAMTVEPGPRGTAQPTTTPFVVATI